ncbi:PDZ and LIM domain protein Zasp isoform X2 [Culicoides brevitarsis]|uniref:PDZ and LIM domain protein Zasp isoform X2 n=1 Tax=Culicoides brevitarsis TaxID=469753 RepID=UPI00307CB60E
MAQLMTVRLTRNDGQPWGFRLQGGKDFGSPLALQKVNVGSIADKAGLLAGDALIRVNNEELFNLRHKDAQDALVRAGNSFELTVSRGGSTWKPSVTPLTSPVPTSAGINVVTKTSLKAMPGQNVAAIGTGHNTAAKPFASNGQGVRSIVNKQYNTPVAMYSDETIAETLSAQTEVLAGGVLGVNFKKNEKVYNSAQSEVFKMLQEQGHEPEPAHNYYWTASHAVGCRAKERSSTPSFVEKFEKKFAYTPSASPYFTGNSGGLSPIPPKTPEPVSREQQQVPQHPTSADVPKQMQISCPPIQTTTNTKLVEISTKDNCKTTTVESEKAPLNTISSALNAHAFNGSSGAATTAQLPSTVSGPKPFSYATPSTFGPTSPPQAVNTPKSPIAYPPAPAPTWSVPPAQAPVFTPKPTESMKAPAVQNLQGKFNVYKQPTSTPRKEPQSIVTAVSIEPKDVSVEEEKPKATEETQIVQCDTKQESVIPNDMSINCSQNDEHKVEEQSSHQSSTSRQSKESIQEIKYKFGLKPQEQQEHSSVLDKEIQDMVAPQIRIVEPRWRTPSRQYLSEFDAYSSTQDECQIHGESFVNDPHENRRPITPSSRPWTPSRSHHRASHIPYYQEQLAWEEGVALSKEFEKKLRTPSPNLLGRPKSPAFGPPPNPLLLIHPQTRDEGKDLSGKYLSGTKLLSPMWEQHHYKNEYLGMESENPHYEKQHQAASHKETNETIERQTKGTSKQKHTERQIIKCENLGYSCVQQNTRALEDSETDHFIKTMEKTTGATLSIQDAEFPTRGYVAQQARKLSVADSDGGVDNNVSRHQGGEQEIKDFAVPTFRSCVSVQQPSPSNSHIQTYSEQSNSVSSHFQNSEYTFPIKSGVPPVGFPTSAETPPQMNLMMSQQQQPKNIRTNHISTIKTTNISNNKPPLPPATNIEQSSFNPSNNHHDPSPILPSKTNPSIKTSSDPVPGLGGISGKPYNVQNVTQPKRGRGVLNQGVGPSGRSPMCGCCGGQVRGPFITALGRIWCPEHFICVNANCKRPLADIGFVEEKGDLYCEYCFEQYLAPNCNKCAKKIKGDCLNAIGKQFHPECFTCSHCGKLFGNSPFFLEEGEPFCQNDWNQLFTTKCFACGFPVEAGDRWVEALNNNYHSQCFNCTMCKKNLEGQSFYAKGGRPFCKNHAR